MNLFTLRFNDLIFEQDFNKKQRIEGLQYQTNLRLFLIGLLTLQVLGNVFDQFWLETIINTSGLLIMLIGFLFKQQIPSFNDPITFLVILAYNLQHPLKCILYHRSNYDQIIESYFISQGTLGLISTWSYGKKTILTLLILIINLTYLGLLSDSWRIAFILCLSSFAMLHSYYYSEYRTRVQYIAMNNMGIIEENLYQQIDINSYIIHFNQKEHNFHLVRQNSVDDLSETKQQNFINCLRNMKVILISQKRRKSIIQSSLMLDQQNKINLEQLIFYLFAQQEKFKQLTKNCTKDNKVFEIIGLTDLDVYHITLIKSFDIKPSIILLIKENKKESQNKSLKYKLKISHKLLNQVQESIQQRIRLCLIYTKQALQKQNKLNSNLNAQFQKFIIFLNSQITKSYNDMNNIYEFHNLNTKSAQMMLTNFDVQISVEECLSIFNLYFQNKQDFSRINLRSNLKDRFIFSDQRKFKQLIFNCLFYVIQTAKPNRIELNELEQKQSSNSKLIKIEILFTGQAFTAEKIAKFPILNPQSLQELKFNSQQQLNLEIPIALMIVRQIGPFNQIRIKQNNISTQNSLIFYIYKNLEEFNLIPIISLHPSENLITKKKSINKIKNGAKTQCYIPDNLYPQLETVRQSSEQMILII